MNQTAMLHSTATWAYETGIQEVHQKLLSDAQIAAFSECLAQDGTCEGAAYQIDAETCSCLLIAGNNNSHVSNRMLFY